VFIVTFIRIAITVRQFLHIIKSTIKACVICYIYKKKLLNSVSFVTYIRFNYYNVCQFLLKLETTIIHCVICYIY